MKPKPLIVVLCLDNHPKSDDINNPLFTALAKKDVVCKARTVPEARRYLTSTTRPHAILVVDAAVSSFEYREVLLRLAEYARAGGTVIYAGTSTVSKFELESTFKDVWDLPWRASTYTNGIYTVNPRVRGIHTNGLARSYSVKATLVENVASENAVYLPPSSPSTLPKGGGSSAGETYQTPAAFATVGRGQDNATWRTKYVILISFLSWPERTDSSQSSLLLFLNKMNYAYTLI